MRELFSFDKYLDSIQAVTLAATSTEVTVKQGVPFFVHNTGNAVMYIGTTSTLCTTPGLPIYPGQVRGPFTLEKSTSVYMRGTAAQTAVVEYGNEQVTGGAGLSTGAYTVIDVTIAISGTVSSEIDFRGYKYLGFLMPAAWTSATLTLKGSAVAAGTKQTIKNDSGLTFPAMTVAVDTVYTIDTNALMIAAVPYLALVSSAQQEAARTIKVFLKA